MNKPLQARRYLSKSIIFLGIIVKKISLLGPINRVSIQKEKDGIAEVLVFFTFFLPSSIAVDPILVGVLEVERG